MMLRVSAGLALVFIILAIGVWVGPVMRQEPPIITQSPKGGREQFSTPHLEPDGIQKPLNTTTSPEQACLDMAQVAIGRSPDRHELFVTTSWKFKRDVSRFFCGMDAGNMTALELGTYKGHGTALLSAVFGQVISVDINVDYLKDAAEYNSGRRNVAYIEMDSYVAQWSQLAANKIDVAVIDADHHYVQVFSDCVNVWHTFPTVKWFIFDDVSEEGVQRAVQEMQDSGAIHDCRPIGLGTDGEAWIFNGAAVRSAEGLICGRGAVAPDSKESFVNAAFMLYTIPPSDLLRAETVFSFKANGFVFTSRFGSGTWKVVPIGVEDRREVSALYTWLPGLPPEGEPFWEVHFNKGRSSFVMTPATGNASKWFGILVSKVNQPFVSENERF